MGIINKMGFKPHQEKRNVFFYIEKESLIELKTLKLNSVMEGKKFTFSGFLHSIISNLNDTEESNENYLENLLIYKKTFKEETGSKKATIVPISEQDEKKINNLINYCLSNSDELITKTLVLNYLLKTALNI